MKKINKITFSNNDNNSIANEIFVEFNPESNEREGRYKIVFDGISNEFTYDEIKSLNKSLNELIKQVASPESKE